MKKDSQQELNRDKNVSAQYYGWYCIGCGLSTNVVLFYAGEIAHAMHNDAMPLVMIFGLLLGLSASAIHEIKNHKYMASVVGVILSLPSLYIFLWIVCSYYIPFYIEWIKTGNFP